MPKRATPHSPAYLLSERTARKAKKEHRIQEQELAQVQRIQEQAELQVKFDQLQAQHDSLVKKAKNAKKAARRKLLRGTVGPSATGPIVVHASASCDEEDEDVVSKHDFLAGTLEGTSEALDAELAVHRFAQRALQEILANSSGRDVIEDTAVNATAAHPLQVSSTPPATTTPDPPQQSNQATSSAGQQTADLLPDNTARKHLFDEDYEPTPSSTVAEDLEAGRMRQADDDLIDEYLERKVLEGALRTNAGMHDERVIRLINSGYLPREAIDALSATKVAGWESTKKALEYLRVKSGTALSAISKAVVDCKQQINLLTNTAAGTTAKAEAIFGPYLSDFVSQNPRAEDVAGRVQRLHDTSAFGHLSCTSKAAINLKETVRQGDDAQLRDTKWLGAICLAVCEDCTKCAANKAKRQDRDNADRAKLLLAAEKSPPCKPGRATEPWDIADAKHDRKLPRLSCFICEGRSPGSRNPDAWLYHCDRCGQAAHDTCERLTEWIENSGSSSFLCKLCTRQKQSALDAERRGPARDWTNSRYIGGGGPAGSGLAASHRHPPAAASEGAATQRPQATPPCSPSAGTQVLPNSPRPSGWDNRLEIASLLQKLVDNSPNPGTKGTSALDTSACSHAATGASNTNVKINNYVMWEESGAGKPRQGTETGSGVMAWAWFKRTNIPIRDAAVNMKGGLGLLAANAISHNMQITLAASMLNEAEVQPEKNMTEREIDLWVKNDREFTWFKTLPDAVLIKVMDRLSASVNPAPFFRLVIAAEIPTMKDGDLYYPVTEFNAHADKWISTLSDLIKGGWQEGSTNLKQVFLASICTCQLVYDQAKREMHEDVLRLIATLKKWIVVQDNEIQSAKAAKASIKNKNKTPDTIHPVDTDKNFDRRVRALFTAMQSTTGTPYTADTQRAPQTTQMWQCQSCGNEWRDDPTRPPRCKKECVYSEHKDFNKLTKYPKGSKPLSWKAYGEPYPPKQQAFFDKRDTIKGSQSSRPEGRRK
jgi:hypothetical protein